MNRIMRLVNISFILLVVIIPYILAALLTGPDYVFNGFLVNPIDGASYLSKMYIGWKGEWRFTLPYTAETSQGAYLFLFYIFLGHVARWLDLPLLVVFHLARVLASLFLLYVLYLFIARVFISRRYLIQPGFLLAAAGSGLGWLVVFTGKIPFDLWVAEAYPFLSMYANPHFPAGLGLLLFAFISFLDNQSWFRSVTLALVGLLMAVIYPFGQVLLIFFALGWSLWNWIENHWFDWTGLLLTSFPGGIFLLYQFIATSQDPLLSKWNEQNITLSPSPLDVLLSLSPAVVVAGLGLWKLITEKDNRARIFLYLWPFWGLFFAYLPVSLQRRFTFGLYIPIAILAVIGVDVLRQRWPRFGTAVLATVFVFSLPTNIFLVASGIISAYSHPKLIYMTQDEHRALSWVESNTPLDAVVLAPPEISLMIPATTGRRVIYAHPFETVNAVALEKQVEEFYSTSGWSNEKERFLKGHQIHYFFWRSREGVPKEIGDGRQIRLEAQFGINQIYSFHYDQ